MSPLNLDLRGLKCPLPVLRTRRALRMLAGGERLVVACTDPMAAIDIPHMVHEDGHTLEGQSAADGVWRFTIRKPAYARGGDGPADSARPTDHQKI